MLDECCNHCVIIFVQKGGDGFDERFYEKHILQKYDDSRSCFIINWHYNVDYRYSD